MKIVDITDIEDIVLAKAEIDKNNPECEGRSNLNEFMSKYCTLTDVLVINDELLSFRYIELFNHQYLFIGNQKDKDYIINFLKSIKYNLNNLKELKMNEFIEYDSYLIHNNKYYKV